MTGMTMEEIARNMGVSKSTVSRALSGKGRIGEDTRSKIREYANSHRDEEKKTGNITVVLPTDAYTTNTPFFQECLLGISEVASSMKYHVLVTAASLNDVRDVKLLVEGKKTDGVILLRGVENDRLLKYLTDKHFPLALAGSCKYEDVIQVDAEHDKAAANLTSVLIGQGYRRFALVMGDMRYQVNQSRQSGFFAALKKYGLDENEQLYYADFMNREPKENTIEDIMSKKVDCIICSDDVICTHLMSCMQACGYRIPTDAAVVSLYNSTNLDCFSPAVTAVNVSARQTGNVIGRQLINKLTGESYNPRTILNYEILLRKSATLAHNL